LNNTQNLGSIMRLETLDHDKFIFIIRSWYSQMLGRWLPETGHWCFYQLLSTS